MATTSVEICNNALTLIGSRRIVALNDPSKEARACNDNYDICRKAVLRLHPWNFAIGRVALKGVDVTNVQNNAGEIQITAAAHGFTTGDNVTVIGVVGTVEANMTGYVTVIDVDNFTFDDSVFANTYSSGGYATLAPANEYLHKFSLPSDYVRLHVAADDSDEQLAAREYVIEGSYLITNYHPVRLRYVKNVTTTTQFDPLFDEALAAYLAEKIAYKITGSEALQTGLQRQLKDIMNRARFVDSVEEPSRQLDSDEWLRARWDTNQGYVRDPMT